MAWADDWSGGGDLAALGRGSSPLASAGFDLDELRTNPEARQAAMDSLRSPYPPETQKSDSATGASTTTSPIMQAGRATSIPSSDSLIGQYSSSNVSDTSAPEMKSGGALTQ